MHASFSCVCVSNLNARAEMWESVGIEDGGAAWSVYEGGFEGSDILVGGIWMLGFVDQWVSKKVCG